MAISDGAMRPISSLEESTPFNLQPSVGTGAVGEFNLLKDVLELISSPLLLYPQESLLAEKNEANDKNRIEELRNASKSRLRSIACEELLHTAAAGMKSLVSNTLKYDFDGNFSSIQILGP